MNELITMGIRMGIACMRMFEMFSIVLAAFFTGLVLSRYHAKGEITDNILMAIIADILVIGLALCFHLLCGAGNKTIIELGGEEDEELAGKEGMESGECGQAGAGGGTAHHRPGFGVVE